MRIDQSTFLELFQIEPLSLELPYIEGDWFRLPSKDLGFTHLFGGQVFGQSLFLVGHLVQKQQMRPHSCHCYFIRPGRAYEPVDFQIIAIGQGRTFQRYQVVAYQGEDAKGPRVIFRAIVSCQKPEASFIEHAKAMPDVASPEDSQSEIELRQSLGLDVSLHKNRVIELRITNPDDYRNPQPLESPRGFWFRYPWSFDQKPSFYHQAMLAYASDYGFVGTMLLPHGIFKHRTPFYLTSLDHSLWYYDDYQPDEWCYFECYSPRAAHGRGIVHGNLYQKGRLIAVATQEGLVRKRQ